MRDVTPVIRYPLDCSRVTFPRRMSTLLVLKLIAVGALMTSTANGAWGQSMTPPKIYTISPTGVNILDGAFTYSHVDLAIGPLKLERSHLGGPETTRAYFGATWSHNWDMYVAVKLTGTVNVNTTVVIGRTKFHYLGQPSTGAAPDNDAVGTSVTQGASGYIFTDRDGTRYNFGWDGVPRVTEIDYPNGSVVNISYANSLPKVISSNSGYAIVLDSNASGVVTAACGFNLTQSVVTTSTTCAGAALKVAYSYGSATWGTALTGFTDARGNLTTISYATTTNKPAVACISLPNSATCRVTNAYDPNANFSQRVTQQTFADGSVWNFTTNGAYAGRDDQDPDTAVYSATMTAPDGGVTHFTFNGNGPTKITDPIGRPINSVYFGQFITSATLPEGNVVQYARNSRAVDAGYIWSAKPTTGLADIYTSTKVFPSTCTNTITCNEPLSVTDANGNTTNYTYDPTHGGVLTETSPANAAGVSAVIRHAYMQRYAWIANGSGYVQAASPAWLLSEDRTCRTSTTIGNACAAGSADEVVTTYDYGPNSGPNNLLLRGKVITADGASLRSCFTYDWLGNKIAETTPRAGLVSCS